MPRPLSILVMGVSGSGKTEIGSALAERLRVPFVDADALHSAENIAKMSSGAPLSDEDRLPWLDAVGKVLARPPVVVACSALRRAYRDRLREQAPGLKIVYLRGDRALLARRLKRRKGHFMPPALLDSQLAALERPDADENALVLDIARRPAELVRAALLRWEEP